MNNKNNINEQGIIDATSSLVSAALGEVDQNVGHKDKKPKYMPMNLVTIRKDVSQEDLARMKVGLREKSQPIVIGDMEIESYEHKQEALAEMQEAENMQRQLREQYEKDKAYFENNVLKRARTAGEIEEDYVKVLHPVYRKKFLDGLAQYGTLAAACKYMKMQHDMTIRGDILRRMLALIPSFKQEVEDAIEEYHATIQMEMHRRAVEGVDKGIYYNGERVATEKVYSDNLLAKMADTHLPEYKEAKQKESNRGNTINVQIIKDFHNYKD